MSGLADASPLTFFLDRSLGRFGVAAALRGAGMLLRTLAEVYGIPEDESIADVEWLALAGTRGWPVLMKDQRIRRRPAERDALLTYGVQAFCLTNGNLSTVQMAAAFLTARGRIEQACAIPGPCL